MELHCRRCEVQWVQAAGTGCFSCGSRGRPGRLAPLLVDPMRGAPVLVGPRLRPGSPRGQVADARISSARPRQS